MSANRMVMLASLALVLGPTFGTAQTVVFVRHAEKAAGTGDVLLSDVGTKRAARLAEVLKDGGVTAVYTTATKRTAKTAEPVATMAKIAPKVRSVSEQPADFVKHLTETHKSGCILVVGHSNTIPKMIDELLRRDSGIQIGETEYDGLFVLTHQPDGSWTLIRAKY